MSLRLSDLPPPFSPWELEAGALYMVESVCFSTEPHPHSFTPFYHWVVVYGIRHYCLSCLFYQLKVIWFAFSF